MGQLISYTSAVGQDQLGIIQTYTAQDGTLAATNLTADSVYVSRVRVERPIRVTSMHIYVGAALGNVDLGIYTGTLSGGLTKVASTGSTAAAGASALQTIALTAAYTLQPGIDYWFAFGSTSGSTTLTVARTAGVVSLVLVSDTMAMTAIKAAAWSTGLPSSLATLTATSNTVWVAAT